MTEPTKQDMQLLKDYLGGSAEAFAVKHVDVDFLHSVIRKLFAPPFSEGDKVVILETVLGEPGRFNAQEGEEYIVHMYPFLNEDSVLIRDEWDMERYDAPITHIEKVE